MANKLFSSEGRLNRKSYFFAGLRLFLLIIGMLVSWSTLWFIQNLMSFSIPGFQVIFMILYVSVLIYAIVRGIFLSIQRLHDLDKSGWFVLLQFIPVVNLFVGIWLLFFKWITGTNKYGEDLIATEK